MQKGASTIKKQTVKKQLLLITLLIPAIAIHAFWGGGAFWIAMRWAFLVGFLFVMERGVFASRSSASNQS